MPGALALGQATRPSEGDLRRLVRQLDDADPEIRESAAQSLMELSRADLSVLRDAAMKQRPLSGEQISALREAVMQVYLESEAYAPDKDRGFLGIHWPPDPRERPGQDVKYDTGVIVVERVPGTAAYRLLRPGDVIVNLPDFPGTDLHARLGLIFQINRMHAGDVLRLQVLRGGRLVDVSVPLSPRPAELSLEENIQPWLKDRLQKAEQYWNDMFGPLAPDVAQTVGVQP